MEYLSVSNQNQDAIYTFAYLMPSFFYPSYN
jgi:hypothetical protein